MRVMASRGLGAATLQDHRADIYALGAIAYFLATGQPQFEGRNALKVLHAHTHDAVLPPSFLLPPPDDLQRVILRCLAKHPRDRYATAEDLERALAECEAAPEWDCEKADDWCAEYDGHPA